VQDLNNLNLVNEMVSQHQSRIREAAKAARRHPSQAEAVGGHSIRVWIGDRLIVWGHAIRGGMPSRPAGAVARVQGLAPLSISETVRSA